MSAAENTRSESDQRVFQCVIALGLHGHAGSSLPRIAKERIVIAQDAVIIRGDELRPDMEVGGRLSQWLRYWHERTEPEKPIVGPYQRYNSRLSQLRGDDHKTRLQTARLRTTFIVQLLKQPGLLQGEILQLAGLQSTSSLDEYRCFVEDTSLDDVAAKFREISALPEGWGLYWLPHEVMSATHHQTWSERSTNC